MIFNIAAGCRLTKDEKGNWWIHVGTKGAILACSKMKPVHSVSPKKVSEHNEKIYTTLKFSYQRLLLL